MIVNRWFLLSFFLVLTSVCQLGISMALLTGHGDALSVRWMVALGIFQVMLVIPAVIALLRLP